jgi:hypothetical protein
MALSYLHTLSIRRGGHLPGSRTQVRPNQGDTTIGVIVTFSAASLDLRLVGSVPGCLIARRHGRIGQDTGPHVATHCWFQLPQFTPSGISLFACRDKRLPESLTRCIEKGWHLSWSWHGGPFSTSSLESSSDLSNPYASGMPIVIPSRQGWSRLPDVTHVTRRDTICDRPALQARR